MQTLRTHGGPPTSSSARGDDRAKLEIVGDRLRHDEAGFAQLALGGFLEQPDLDDRLDAKNERDDDRDSNDEARAKRHD